MSPDPGFCCISIEAEDAESCAALLLECGAVGAEIVDATHLKCFVQGSPDAASALVEGLHLPGIRTVSMNVVHDENWVARCDELWETVEAGQIRIVPVQSGNWEIDGGNKVAAGMLSEYPNLKAILAGNDSMALGAVSAIRAAGKAGKVQVVGYDNIDAIKPMLKDGRVLATADQAAAKQAVFGIETALKLVRKEPVENLKDGVIDTPVQLVTHP